MNLPIILSAESQVEDAAAVVYSNVSVVNVLFDELFTEAEINPEALLSYYVDYYLAQVNNGGFSQFAYNCGWQLGVVERVDAGLVAIGQVEHLELWRVARAHVDDLTSEDREALLNEGVFGSPAAAALDEKLADYVEKFYALEDTAADLTTANARWLQGRPGLKTYPRDELEDVIAALVLQQPDRAEREAAAAAAHEANMTAEERSGRRYCAERGEEFEFLTAGSGLEFEGDTRFAMWFRTDRGVRITLATDTERVILGSDDESELARWPLESE